LNKKAYLLVIVILIAAGSTSAYAINITLGGTVDITQILNMMGNRITNVGNPTTPSDAATKAYVDSAPGTDTLALLGCATDQIARFDGNNWVCGKFTIKNNPNTTLDSIGEEGGQTSIAIGTDNLPVISYFDATNLDLKVVHCGNTSCSAGNTITTVDSTGDVGLYTSIAIGTDGNPVISYFDFAPNFDLKVVHCGNTLCSSGNTITIVDSTNFVGRYSSIAIGSDGNPVISYRDDTNGDLKVAHCGNTSCSSGNALTPVDSTGSVGRHSSIAIGSDHNPVISYQDNTNGNLKVAHCGDTACSSGNTITIVDSTDFNVGEYTSIAIGTDNLPVISYFDGTNQNLKILHCGNTSCSLVNSITSIDTIGIVGLYTSIAIDVYSPTLKSVLSTIVIVFPEEQAVSPQ